MSISLIGIVCVQIFWIMNAVKINEEHFGRNVNEALNELVSKIETNETSQIITGNICSINLGNSAVIDCGDIDTTFVRSFNSNDEIEKIKKEFSVDSLAFINDFSSKTKTKKIRFKEKVFIDSLSSELTTSKIKKKLALDKDISQDIENVINTSITINDDTSKNICVTVIKNSNKIDVKTSKFRNVVEKMLIEYESKKVPLNSRLKQINFSKLLKSVLKNHGIELQYEYIVNSKNHKNSALISSGYDKNSKESVFTINLFPNDLIDKSDYLNLYFPTRQEYIYKSLFFMILGSVIFTLIILLTFLVTIFTILRQKKISEIKNDFINNMTHEFKTPIATISLASDSISNPLVLEDKEQIIYLSRIIKEESMRMNTKVERVLQFSLFDKNDIEFHFTSLHVHEQIEKAIEKIKLQVEQKNGKLTTELNATRCVVDADSEHLISALLNIFDNAIKYSPSIIEINVATYNYENTVCITISDKGIGIDKEDTKMIFERFFRVHTGNIHNVKGFGLGLCYVKEIVTAFKGKVSVQSIKGLGSTFIICLPLKKYEQ